jgi:Flp pilus assembly protein TadG
MLTTLFQSERSSRRQLKRRRGIALSVELVVALPILFIVLLAIVEFGLLLMSSQGVSAAANLGAREAALSSSSYTSVKTAVNNAVVGYNWKNYTDVVIFVDGVKDTGGTNPMSPNNALQNAPSGAIVSVTVNLPMNEAAPDGLKLFGITLAGHEVTATFVTRKE